MFASTDWLFPTQTRLVIGYRSENVLKTSQDATTAPALTALNNKLNARELSANQTIQKGVDIYFRTASSFRMANIDDYTNTNPSTPLRPQTSKDKELGLKIRQDFSHFTARYFLQNTVDEIYLDKSLNSGFGYNVNISPTKRSGIELEGAISLGPKVIVSGAIQSMKAVFDGGINAGKHIPLVSEQVATARMNYRLDDKQSIETALRMLSSAYVGDDVSNSCANKTPSSRLFDGLYRWKNNAFDFAFGVTNITNVQTYSFAYLCTKGIYPEAGRTFRATVKYNF
jgi:iron complex outermembrane receptor protein